MIVIWDLNCETSCYPVLKVRHSGFGIAFGVVLKEGGNTVKYLLLMTPSCKIFFNVCHTWLQNFAFLVSKSNIKWPGMNCLGFLAGLKQFQYRILWNRVSSLGIWRSVFSRRELLVFSSWMQLCLYFWRVVQTHVGFSHRKLMQTLGTLPGKWQIFIVSLWRWVGKKCPVSTKAGKM